MGGQWRAGGGGRGNSLKLFRIPCEYSAHQKLFQTKYEEWHNIKNIFMEMTTSKMDF
jgi:hypothetical protein